MAAVGSGRLNAFKVLLQDWRVDELERVGCLQHLVFALGSTSHLAGWSKDSVFGWGIFVSPRRILSDPAEVPLDSPASSCMMMLQPSRSKHATTIYGIAHNMVVHWTRGHQQERTCPLPSWWHRTNGS
eukprot:1668189-Amphidinium_carterae.1